MTGQARTIAGSATTKTNALAAKGNALISGDCACASVRAYEQESTTATVKIGLCRLTPCRRRGSEGSRFNGRLAESALGPLPLPTRPAGRGSSAALTLPGFRVAGRIQFNEYGSFPVPTA
jgi:hypothetical protein